MWCDMWCDMWGGRGADKYPLEHATGLRTVHGTVPFARGDGGSCGVCSVCCVERFDYVARYDKERFFVCSAPGRTRNAGRATTDRAGRATVSASRTLARPLVPPLAESGGSLSGFTRVGTPLRGAPPRMRIVLGRGSLWSRTHGLDQLILQNLADRVLDRVRSLLCVRRVLIQVLIVVGERSKPTWYLPMSVGTRVFLE